MTTKSYDITIGIVHWNTPECLEKCLASIVTTTKQATYEVIVIDNDSSDKAYFRKIRERYDSDERFIFIENDTNEGGVATNIAYRRRRGTYFVIIGPDAELQEGCLDILFDFMEAHPNAGAATANLFNFDGTPQLYYRRILTPTLFVFSTLIGRAIDKLFFNSYFYKHYRYSGIDITAVSEVEQPAGPCIIERPDALGEYNTDATMPFYFGDVDVSKRMYDAGYRVYLVPTARIFHQQSTSFKRADNAWKRREYYKGLKAYLRKHHPYLFPFLWLIAALDRALYYAIRLLRGEGWAIGRRYDL